jgi:hypothetical protein
MFRTIGDLMARLGGADLETLKQVPQERNRFIQMAGVLLTTAGIAVISMTFALHNGVSEQLGWSLIFGVLWGVVILNLDRFLVLSMGSIRSRPRLILISLPRFALAFVLALVISTPLVLRIFASDINAQLFTMRLQHSTAQGNLEAHSKEQQEANKLLGEINKDKSTLAGNLPAPVGNPQLQTAQATVKKLTPKVQNAQAKMIKARATWQCEKYGDGPGCHGASNRPGQGVIADAKEQAYQAAKDHFDELNGQLTTALAQVASGEKQLRKTQKQVLANDQVQANQELPGLEAQYTKLTTFLSNEAAQGTEVNAQNTGILAQLQALSDVSAKNPSLNAARLAVLALFFLIEILPVTVKFLLNLGPLTTYESIVKSRDDEITDRAHVHRAEERHRSEADSRERTKKEDDDRTVEEGKSRARVKVEEDMREREVSLGKEANEHVAAEMKNVLDVALKEWSARVRDTLARGGPAPAPAAGPDPGGPGPAGPGSGGADPGSGGPGPGPGGPADPGGPAAGDPAGNGSGGPGPHVTHTFGLPGPERL